VIWKRRFSQVGPIIEQKYRPHHRAEIVVERGVALGKGAEDGQLILAIIADGKFVADLGGLQEPVAAPVGILDCYAGPSMIWVLIGAALKIRSERPRLVRDPILVEIAQPLLPAVRAGKPSEHVIERTVFHHQHNDGVERGVSWRRKMVARLQSVGLGGW
jgi:hypothetical protein